MSLKIEECLEKAEKYINELDSVLTALEELENFKSREPSAEITISESIYLKIELAHLYLTLGRSKGGL